jgi:hypothetical protein
MGRDPVRGCCTGPVDDLTDPKPCWDAEFGKQGLTGDGVIEAGALQLPMLRTRVRDERVDSSR